MKMTIFIQKTHNQGIKNTAYRYAFEHVHMTLKTNTIKQMITQSKRERRKEDMVPLGKPQKKNQEKYNIYQFIYFWLLIMCCALCSVQKETQDPTDAY